MTDIFLSRPTWISQEFRTGLDNFLSFLKGHNLNPRTIGVSDYGNKSPLDEIIALMQECRGAIILGYPQIKLEQGILRETKIPSKDITELLLPTEWNHIETGLAYARNIPLLLIHHINVTRGVFDRGATNSYIYETNLIDPDWPLRPAICGAITNWKRSVLEIPTSKKISLNELLKLLDDAGLKARKGTNVNLGVYNAEISTWLEINDEQIVASRFPTVIRAKEIAEISESPQRVFHWENWVFEHVGKDLRGKLRNALLMGVS